MFVFGRVRQLQIPLLDKWRLPLILVRVSKSLPLRESDEKIWACFVHNKTQEELLVTIASALARQVPSTCRLPSIQRGAGSQSGTGTATPCTLSGSLSASLSTSNNSTPNRSRCSSTTKAADLTVPIATATTSTAVDSVVSPQPLRRCSSKLGLPPLKPSPQSQGRSSQSASPLPSTSSPVPLATAGTSQASLHPSYGSLNNLWATMGSKTTLTPLVSRSAPSSPQQRTAEITFGAAELSEDSERILNRTYGTVGSTNRRLAVLESSTKLNLERVQRNSSTTTTTTTAAATTDTRFVPHHHQQHYHTFSSLSQWAAGLLRHRTSSPQDVQTQQSTALHTTEKQNRKS